MLHSDERVPGYSSKLASLTFLDQQKSDGVCSL